MPSTRRSSRLKGDAPRGELIIGQARRLNRNTLTEFTKSQSLLIAKRSRIRKKVKTPKRIRALTKLIKASIKILATPLPSINPPAKVTSLSARVTPSQARKKSNTTPSTTPFDPTIEGESAHYVTLIITPVIDSSRKIDAVICQNYNINLGPRDSLSVL